MKNKIIKFIVLVFVIINPFIYKLKALDDYTINKMGKISLVEKTQDSFDILIAVTNSNERTKYRKNGDFAQDYLVVEKGILNSTLEMEDDNAGEHFKGMRINFHSNKEDAIRAFEFLADHTYIEWSLVSYEMPDGIRTHLYTSYEKDKEFFGAARVFNIIKSPTPIKELEHYHNHPREEHESFGKYAFPSDADIDFRNYVLKRKIPSAIFKIRTEGRYLDYSDTLEWNRNNNEAIVF